MCSSDLAVPTNARKGTVNKDRLEILKETEDYIPPIHTLGTDELQAFYSQFGAAPEIIREMFLSGEIFHKLLYSDETPPVMRLDKKSEETAFKNFLSEKNISDESVFLIYNYSKDEVDQIATAELADKFICNSLISKTLHKKPYIKVADL